MAKEAHLMISAFKSNSIEVYVFNSRGQYFENKRFLNTDPSPLLQRKTPSCSSKPKAFGDKLEEMRCLNKIRSPRKSSQSKVEGITKALTRLFHHSVAHMPKCGSVDVLKTKKTHCNQSIQEK